MITLDFETYSEIDIKTHGAAVYAAHLSTEILCLAYDLDNGQGKHVWMPGMKIPHGILAAIAFGGGVFIEAHNSSFEYLIWNLVGVKKYGWMHLPPEAFRCSQSKALAYGLPSSLDQVAAALRTPHQKSKEGTRLINKFSKPHKPSKKDPRTRIRPEDDPADFNNMLQYCIQDVSTEQDISRRVPDLHPIELEVWQLDQKINQRGVHIDRDSLEGCTSIIEQALEKYEKELVPLTGGMVKTVGQHAKIVEWLGTRGVSIASVDKDHVVSLLKRSNLPPDCRRVLEIRQILGSASVKKLYAMQRYLMTDDRIRYAFKYHEAHTGRWTSGGPQFHNFPKATVDNVDQALTIINRGNLDLVESEFRDPIDAVAACLRGLITAGPGAELICSDFSAIEAIVLAFLAGEQWRMKVFRSHGMIYEKSASMISDIPFQEFIDYKIRTGKHHPLRAELGKFAELASGFGGSVGAWKRFGADKYLTNVQIKEKVYKWRGLSPNIVTFWHVVEEATKNALRYPEVEFKEYGMTFCTHGDALAITLLSGRNMWYQSPRIDRVYKPQFDKEMDVITYKVLSQRHWICVDTYGGKLTENIIQATARDILANSMLQLEAAGYPIVTHTHDECSAEVMAGTGSIEEFESIMSRMPAWCADWPIVAKGGWRGYRYRKD